LSSESKKLWNLLKVYKKQLVILVMLVVINALLHLLFPFLERKLVDEGFIAKDFSVVLKIVAVTISLVISMSVIDIMMEKVRTKIRADFIFKLYENICLHICNINIRFLSGNTTELFSKLQTDIIKITQILDEKIFLALARGIGALGGIIGLFFLNWKMACAVLVFVPIKYYTLKWFSAKKQELTKVVLKSSSDFANWVDTFSTGVEEVKLFQMQKLQLDVFRTFQTQAVSSERQSIMLDACNWSLDRIIMEFITSTVFVLGAVFILDESMTLGGVFAFSMYLMYVVTPLSMLMNIKYTLSGILPSVWRYYKFLELPKETEGGVELDFDTSKPLFAFKNVCFGYDDKKLFSDINFVINSGEKIALSGKNGAGKTTLIRLLLRLYEATEGSIECYGQNVNDLDLLSYRQQFAVVSQKVYLFENSVFFNVALTKNDVDYSRVAKILEMVGLDDKNVNDNIGSNGVNLSGGQKQKLALARFI